MTITTLSSSSRMRSQTSMPDSSGSMMSSRMRSGLIFLAILKASAPVVVPFTPKPWQERL
jgi:hypothetical protein